MVREIRARAEAGRVAPVVFALVEEISLGTRLGLRYATAYRFRYDPNINPLASQEGQNTGGLTISSSAYGDIGAEAERSQVMAEILPIWEKHKNLYNGRDVSMILMDIVKDSQAISVESGSGVWSVPARFLGVIERLESLVRQIGALPEARRAHLRVRENFNWPRTIDALRQAALDDVLSDIRAVDTKMDGLADQTKLKPGSVQAATLAGVITELQAVQQKTAAWAQISGLRDERIERDSVAVGARAVQINRLNRAARESRMAEATRVVLNPTVTVPGMGEGREERMA